MNEYIFEVLRVLSREVTQSDCMCKMPLADSGLQNAEYRWCQAPRKGSDDAGEGNVLAVGDGHRVQVLFSEVPGAQLVFTVGMMISFCSQALGEGWEREISLF